MSGVELRVRVAMLFLIFGTSFATHLSVWQLGFVNPKSMFYFAFCGITAIFLFAVFTRIETSSNTKSDILRMTIAEASMHFVFFGLAYLNLNTEIVTPYRIVKSMQLQTIGNTFFLIAYAVRLTFPIAIFQKKSHRMVAWIVSAVTSIPFSCFDAGKFDYVLVILILSGLTWVTLSIADGRIRYKNGGYFDGLSNAEVDAVLQLIKDLRTRRSIQQ